MRGIENHAKKLLMTMTNFDLRILSDDVLREKALPVATVDAETASFMRAMLDAMYRHQGIGLAANQVGVLKRIIVVDLSEARDGTEALLMANPEIIWQDETATYTYKEGCLSVPEQYADVTRPKRIRVRYLDVNNAMQELEAEDLLSQAIQHEIDHLNGVLFIDHLSSIKRGIITRKVEKWLRQRETHVM